MFCRQSTVPWCLKFIPISCMGPKHAPKDTYLIFHEFICTGACTCSSNLNYAHKCIENSFNATKCPNKPWKITKIHTTLLLFYADTRNTPENTKRQWISFCPQRWDIPYRKPSCLLWEAPVRQKHIPIPAPNGTNILPRHVDAAPW